ncbi:hypothetical protein LIER_03404 [Lithospermum erythrorhizon]|uniref:Integrase catalytic domain-containing protein n=1 Tax=Lithospermum erythrorhizon TaxID=34254 RepID=A0AAV3NU70_LITER
MIGNKSYLTKIERLKEDCVTFGGGAKGKIIEKGCLSVDGLSELENVLLVDGLTINLISISQLCDKGMKVSFTKDACAASNNSDKLILKGARNIQQLISKEVSKSLQKIRIKEKICGECQVGKQTKVKKSEAFDREKQMAIIRIRSDHDKEFENSKFNDFCSSERIKHEFLAPITPKQNGIVERKNKNIQEMARVMLHVKKIPVKFWAEAVNIACHIHQKNHS